MDVICDLTQYENACDGEGAMQTPKYMLEQLVTDKGVTALGWSECQRIASLIAFKCGADYTLIDDVRSAVMMDIAGFLIKVRENVRTGASEMPKSVGGMMYCRGRNAASNWLYHNRFKVRRLYCAVTNAAALAREAGLSL